MAVVLQAGTADVAEAGVPEARIVCADVSEARGGSGAGVEEARRRGRGRVSEPGRRGDVEQDNADGSQAAANRDGDRAGTVGVADVDIDDRQNALDGRDGDRPDLEIGDRQGVDRDGGNREAVEGQAAEIEVDRDVDRDVQIEVEHREFGNEDLVVGAH